MVHIAVLADYWKLGRFPAAKPAPQHCDSLGWWGMHAKPVPWICLRTLEKVKKMKKTKGHLYFLIKAETKNHLKQNQDSHVEELGGRYTGKTVSPQGIEPTPLRSSPSFSWAQAHHWIHSEKASQTPHEIENTKSQNLKPTLSDEALQEERHLDSLWSLLSGRYVDGAANSSTCAVIPQIYQNALISFK